MELVECVPNFSEGRRPEILEGLVAAISSGPRVRVLDAGMDADHHRSVITFVAPPADVSRAALRGVEFARDHIDLREHVGVHPRMGAADVIPFVPLRGVSMQACVDIAHATGAAMARELGVPVYFYGRAARRSARARLAAVRGRGFEGLADRAAGDEPDLPDEAVRQGAFHPSAGASAVGARDFLIAFNVVLDSEDLTAARAIARAVRERDGGLKGIRALGIPLASRKRVQVSMNVCDFRRAGLCAVFDEVDRLAAERGIDVLESELIGLAPRAALDRDIAAHVRLVGFDPDRHVIEDRIG